MATILTRRALVLLVAGIMMSASGVAHADGFSEKGRWIVNVNEATFDQLKTIPGVGSEIADEIFRHRPYSKVEDLVRVKGIGERKLESIRPYVKVKGPNEPYREKKK